MLIQTLLNRCQKFKSFVYHKVRLMQVEGVEALVVEVLARKNSPGRCSICHRKAGTYDHQPRERLFQFVPLWGIPVYLAYRMRRIDCPDHGVRIEALPWARGKGTLTHALELFLARWARRLSWQEVAQCFGVSWQRVYRSVQAVVDYGLKHRSLKDIVAIGVDEVYFGKGAQFLTVVYQIQQGCRRLLSVSPGRDSRSLLKFFRLLGRERTRALQFICSDMWKPYVKVIAKKAPQALHILDRFHIVANFNKVVDAVRAGEARQMAREGYEPVLKNAKYCFLKRPENLSPTQSIKLKELLQYNLKTVRVFLLKESFQGLWTYSRVGWARWYLKKWCARANRSRLVPVKKFVRSMRKHEERILNWFRAGKRVSTGVVEGFNRKINLTTRKAYGYRSLKVLETALYHTLGKLPEPPETHRFC